MKDPRYAKLASLLIHHSCTLKPGERVLIDAQNTPIDFTVELVRQIGEAGGEPFVNLLDQRVSRALTMTATESQMKLQGQVEAGRMAQMQAYIGIRGGHNLSEGADVPRERVDLYEKYCWGPVHRDIRVPKTNWVVIRWPNASMAQAAAMSTEAFEDFYFRVCTGVDYAAMDRAMDPLKALMDRTDRVQITGPGTDLSFSIKGIGAIKCAGERNIPDGECFTAPVRDSVNGVLQYNCETLNRGTIFNAVRLVFKNGKIVEASADSPANTKKLNEILDSDEGARYIGEWSLGFNPHVLNPMKDTLFDEKIAGSFHMTPGQAYQEAWNGNKSQVHWDMVCIQRKEYGGGEISFDGQVIRKDGIFVPEDLKGLNPDRLGGIDRH
jgi:aminopeptidase